MGMGKKVTAYLLIMSLGLTQIPNYAFAESAQPEESVQTFETPASKVAEEPKAEAPAPAVTEELKAETPAPVVTEEPRAEEAPASALAEAPAVAEAPKVEESPSAVAEEPEQKQEIPAPAEEPEQTPEVPTQEETEQEEDTPALAAEPETEVINQIESETKKTTKIRKAIDEDEYAYLKTKEKDTPVYKESKIGEAYRIGKFPDKGTIVCADRYTEAKKESFFIHVRFVTADGLIEGFVEEMLRLQETKQA